MRPPSSSLSPYTYTSITHHCGEQIAQFMVDSRRHTGVESQFCKERAYGVYMGWRALVAESADPITYARDDRRFESLLV
jgi:hypothetical protein